MPAANLHQPAFCYLGANPGTGFAVSLKAAAAGLLGCKGTSAKCPVSSAAVIGACSGGSANCAGLCHYDHSFMTMDIVMDIPAGEFKAKCLQLMDRVARSREPIVITKRGKPVAKLVPPDEPEPRPPLFGYMAGTAEIRGDIVNMPQLEWSALTGEEDHLYADLEPRASSPRVSGSTRRRKQK
jgi:prevent-host-death family protein